MEKTWGSHEARVLKLHLMEIVHSTVVDLYNMFHVSHAYLHIPGASNGSPMDNSMDNPTLPIGLHWAPIGSARYIYIYTHLFVCVCVSWFSSNPRTSTRHDTSDWRLRLARKEMEDFRKLLSEHGGLGTGRVRGRMLDGRRCFGSKSWVVFMRFFG